ncbi:MAG TPA: hypothetical protein ENI92_02675 [Bacteroidetes bacterium]|nr:hypothetical protein [Bacteroidota bacterium]
MSLFSRIKIWIDRHGVDWFLVVLTFLFIILIWLIRDEVISLIGYETLEQSRINGYFSLSLSFALLYLLLLFVHFSRRGKLRGLQKRHDRCVEERASFLRSYRLLAEGYLASLGRNALGFGTVEGCAERLTLYTHDNDSDSFLPVARFSFHPQFARRGRWSMPDNVGVLARVWKEGWYFDCDFPDPGADLELYIERCREMGWIREDVIGEAMKARLFCGIMIKDPKELRPLALLLLEATKPDRYKEGELRKAFAEPEETFLQELGEIVALMAPTLHEAMTAGF